MKNSQLMDYMVFLHFIDFISWGVLDNGPLYCITLWASSPLKYGVLYPVQVLCQISLPTVLFDDLFGLDQKSPSQVHFSPPPRPN
jgi:hypothetical protein